MNRIHWTTLFRRMALPMAVFIVVFFSHALWTEFFSPQAQWVSLNENFSHWRHYLETQTYWLGWSYAITLAFTAAAYRKYRIDRRCETPSILFGGITLTGFLSVAGCFLLGCCGSPMLAVYASLFGAKFFSFAKPLVAFFTTATVIVAWLRLRMAVGPTIPPQVNTFNELYTDLDSR